MRQHLLDPDGVVTLPEGYMRINTEVGFLQAATVGEPLLVCGERLCKWAELFFRGRGEAFRYARPIVDELCDVCPGLSADQARLIVAQLGAEHLHSLEQPLTGRGVLEQLYPMDLWRRTPSSSHVADWLVWLYEADPAEYVWPLLVQLGKRWHEGLNQPESAFYCSSNRNEAKQSIEQWLVAEEPNLFSIAFPADVPAEIQQDVVRRWNSKIVSTKGAYFSKVLARDTPYTLKEQTANYAAEYYARNPSNITGERLHELARFLGRGALSKLRNILPPKEPEPTPVEAHDVLNWFRDSYFPYREWQHEQSNSSEASEVIIEVARQFALWYLEAFPRALVGSALAPFMAMKRMLAQKDQEGIVTLVVVLDGLHYGDARELMQKIGAAAPRLALAADDLAFASLPTITQFCKPSLFSGTPPRLAEEVGPVGKVVADRQDPLKALAQAAPGELFLWRVEEPDKTYHWRNNSASLHHEVEGTLLTVAKNIREITEKVPDHLYLQIVVTTDHGRLLGRSQRQITTPPQMESHGRAAWGPSMIDFQGATHVVDGNVAHLDSYSFGLNEDVAVVLDESAFQTNDQRGGSERYAHGGLFPEEVIVPWLTYARDVKAPALDVTITGKGIARQQGALQLHVVNVGLQPVEIYKVRFQLPHGEQSVETKLKLAPHSDARLSLDHEPWFSAEEAKLVTASVSARLSNGLVFELPADISVDAEDMYRRDNILEDLF